MIEASKADHLCRSFQHNAIGLPQKSWLAPYPLCTMLLLLE